MDYCQVRYEGGNTRPPTAVAEVVYTSAQWAAHAKDKLHGFEYPPGYRLIVKPVMEESVAGLSKPQNNLKHIAETLAQATSLIQAAGLNPGKHEVYIYIYIQILFGHLPGQLHV